MKIDNEFLGSFQGRNPEVKVNGKKVWDYKVVGSFLKLISDDTISDVDEFEPVTLQELAEYAQDMDVSLYSETEDVIIRDTEVSNAQFEVNFLTSV